MVRFVVVSSADLLPPVDGLGDEVVRYLPSQAFAGVMKGMSMMCLDDDVLSFVLEDGGWSFACGGFVEEKHCSWMKTVDVMSDERTLSLFCMW